MNYKPSSGKHLYHTLKHLPQSFHKTSHRLQCDQPQSKLLYAFIITSHCQTFNQTFVPLFNEERPSFSIRTLNFHPLLQIYFGYKYRISKILRILLIPPKIVHREYFNKIFFITHMSLKKYFNHLLTKNMDSNIITQNKFTLD